MPRNANSAIENNFIGGFVTQATALNFPENAAFDQDNVVFSERGIVSRRLGMDFENNYTTKTLSNTEKAQSTYHWKNAAGDGNINLVVQQNGDILYFYNTSNSLSLSGGVSSNSVALSSFMSIGASASNLDQNECQYSTGLGYLFVVHPYCDPFYVLYNPADGTFTSRLISFSIRDLTGIAETGNVDSHPTSLTANHKYNLLNQGWTVTKMNTYQAAAGVYPSNADVWWIFNDSTNTFSPATTYTSNSRGSTPAPQGFFRLNPWDTARSLTCIAQYGDTLILTGVVDQTSNTLRPSATEFHSGRVFYTGVNAPGYNSNIYFSKIIQSPVDFGVCASSNDPTSQSLFDFLPSDGGIISIPQAGTIYKLVSLGATLLVFGANGVWAITGSQGIGFTATDFTVSLVGMTRSVSGCSFVTIEGSVAWWNATGINIVQNDPQKGLSIQSMTDGKIKDFYLDVNATAKRFARGAYNPRTHVIQWLYKEATASSITDTYNFDSIINFNTLIGAWSTWTIPNTIVSLNSIVVIEGSGSLAGSNNIVDNSGNQIIDDAGELLITYGFSQTSITTSTKYLVYASGAFTFAECFNPSYKDWFKVVTNGIDYTSFFTTGYRVKTQGERNFQTNYIFIFTDLEDGFNSYTFQSLWNYGNTGDSGRWSGRQTVAQAVTHTETHFDASRRKLKVRGAGTAVQFKFGSVSGLPFNIIGWSTYDTANAAA